VMEDGDRCGQTAPRFGPYAGRCDDHREEEAPTWDPELLAALRPAASIPVAAIDNGDELAGEEAFDDETMELVMAVAEAKYAFDAAQREVNDRMDALVRSIKAISVE
jgi:hypothetical protein